MRRNYLREIFFVALSTTVMIALYFLVVPFLEFVELKAWDFHFKQRGVMQPSGRVAYITIDEESINKEGRWPWPRRKIALLIQAAQEYGAKIVGLDMGFFENDLNLRQQAILDLKPKIRSNPSAAVKSIEGLLDAMAKEEDDDVILSTTLRQLSIPVVLGYYFYFDKNDYCPPTPPSEVLDKSQFSAVRIIENPPHGYLNEAVGMETNIPIIESVVPSKGFFNVLSDPDGTIRWMPLVIRYENRFFPSLPLKTLSAGFPDKPLLLTVDQQGIQRINIGPVSIPTNSRGEMLVNHYGSAFLFPHYSAFRIMRREAPADCLKDKIIIIGNTTKGLHDMRPTPFFPAFPGVEMHCTVIENIINQQFLDRSDRTGPLTDITAIVGTGIIFLLFSFVCKNILSLTAVMTILTGCYIVITHLAFLYFGTWLIHVYPLCNLLLAYTGISASRFLVEEKEKHIIRQTFSLYVHQSVVKEMLDHPELLRLGGEKKELSVLFSDIRKFTSLSEMLPPEELVFQLNEYLTRMTRVVFDHHGTLDKYIGDAVMAIFGAPLMQEDHAYRACCTALDMISSLEVLQQSWQKREKPVFHIGIGINSGPMIVGNMGSEHRFDYTVLGDNVNLASRLEGLTKVYGVPIVVSASTWNAVKDRLMGRELDIVRVQGKLEPVAIYQIMGRITDPSAFDEPLGIYRKALACYRNRNWSDAATLFKEVENRWPGDPPACLYLQRCRELLDSPPGMAWNPITTLDRKYKI